MNCVFEWFKTNQKYYIIINMFCKGFAHLVDSYIRQMIETCGPYEWSEVVVAVEWALVVYGWAHTRRPIVHVPRVQLNGPDIRGSTLTRQRR